MARGTCEEILLQYVLEEYHCRRQQQTSEHGPLIVGIQGPQGCGKSTLTAALVAKLAAPPRSLKVSIASLDDFYLKHEDQLKLTSAHPGNVLLRTRGQPGTHDIDLLMSTLQTLHDGEKESILLPVYDKSKFNGQGDRLPLEEWKRSVCRGLDILILEGWCLGFTALGQSELEDAYTDNKRADAYYRRSPIAHTIAVNEHLESYARQIYPYISAFVQIKPLSLQWVYEWRLEQEETMKAQNGGLGMSTDQVKAFIDGYMPGYELFGHGPEATSVPWSGRGLQLLINQDRSLIDVSVLGQSGDPNCPASQIASNWSQVARLRGGAVEHGIEESLESLPQIDKLSRQAFAARIRRMEHLVGLSGQDAESQGRQTLAESTIISQTLAVLDDVEKLKARNGHVKQFLNLYDSTPDLHPSALQMPGIGRNFTPIGQGEGERDGALDLGPRERAEILLGAAEEICFVGRAMQQIKDAQEQGLFSTTSSLLKMIDPPSTKRFANVRAKLLAAKEEQDHLLSKIAVLLGDYDHLIQAQTRFFLASQSALMRMQQKVDLEDLNK